jgi:hypothetical protein
MDGRMSWAEYREAHGITAAEEPAAFAAYLPELSQGQWDGAAEPRTPPASPGLGAEPDN